MDFRVKDLKDTMPGWALIQWDHDGPNGLPRRSLQVEKPIADLWASAPEMVSVLSTLLEFADPWSVPGDEGDMDRWIAAVKSARRIADILS